MSPEQLLHSSNVVFPRHCNLLGDWMLDDGFFQRSVIRGVILTEEQGIEIVVLARSLGAMIHWLATRHIGMG